MELCAAATHSSYAVLIYMSILVALASIPAYFSWRLAGRDGLHAKSDATPEHQIL